MDFLLAVYMDKTSGRHNNKVTKPFYSKYAKNLSLTLTERSKVKSDIFYRLLGVDFLYVIYINETPRRHNNTVIRPFCS